MFHAAHRAVRAAIGVSTIAVAIAYAPPIQAQKPTSDASARQSPNYELAAAWTAQKVSRMVFDTSVTPRWLETSDRFWYSYNTRAGRRFMLVDPVKKTKGPLFDHAKMAAALTMITRIPYDAQHLPFSQVRFVKNDAAFEFDVQVPRDAVIPTTKPKAITTDQQGGLDEQTDEHDMDEDPLLQQGQRGQGGQRGSGDGAGRGAASTRPRTLKFEYDMATAKVALIEDSPEEPRRPTWASLSPDGKTILFARNHNLYMMDAENFAKAQKSATDKTIVEHQLTTDGEEHYSFGGGRGGGRGNQQQQQQQQDEQEQGQQQEEQGEDAKNIRTRAGNVVWAPDSSKFALVRRDARKVKDLWVINTLASPRPTLETYRYAMPGEENIAQTEMWVFDVASKQRVKVKAERFKDQTMSIATAPAPSVRRDPRNPLVPQWLSPSSDTIYFTRLSRDMHKLDVCVADAATGEVTPLVEERLNTYIESRPLRLTNNGQELVFWSERDGWAHFYLYDAKTGQLKNRITEGEFVATGLDSIDEKTRVMYFNAAGREKDEDPYYTHYYRVNLDGTGLKLLNPGNASHSASGVDSMKYFVNNSTRIDGTPESVLYDTLGNLVMKLEAPDLQPLMDAGFKFPEPFTVKADDGVTDLYGVMYKPFDFDPSRKYPIIAYVYPGPQTEGVTKNFNPRSNNISLAQFGFIVVEVGNRGGHPTRSKWYHNYGYGNLRDYGLADKKAAIEQLAIRHPFIDINRVGIWGHSGGGFMSAAAMLVYPDFFKVGWSESGNHENNIYNNTWSEKHHGIKEVEKDGKVTFEYDIDKNSELAKNLKGNLMLITGDIDNNVHPGNTYRLADALIKANKRFDMFVLPGVRHSFAAVSGYVNWLRGDYFARHLLGEASNNIDITELNREAQQTG
ncbi:MAG: DPP IV N-terminal domain-containing protein, partial [Vicinamibacterales bacterium]